MTPWPLPMLEHDSPRIGQAHTAPLPNQQGLPDLVFSCRTILLTVDWVTNRCAAAWVKLPCRAVSTSSAAL